MRSSHLTRATVAGAVVVMATGLAVPAFAGTSASDGTGEHTGITAAPLTVDQLKARVDTWIAARLAKLAREDDRVNASTYLTDAQKAAATAKIQARIAALNALKTKVDSETTTAAIKADLAAARLAALKAWVDDRIDRMIARLEAKATKIAASTHLTDAQKAAAAAKIQAEITALTALKAKVDAETTAKAVLADLEHVHARFDFFTREGRSHKGGNKSGLHEPAATVAALTSVGRHAGDSGTRLAHPLGGGYGGGGYGGSYGGGYGGGYGGHGH